MSTIDDNIFEAANALTVQMERKGEFLKELQHEQLCISDIEHLIELGKLDAIGFTHAVLELKKHLQLRRIAKDKLDAINVAKTSSIKGLTNYMNNRKNRKYTPRVLTHLGVLGGAKA